MENLIDPDSNLVPKAFLRWGGRRGEKPWERGGPDRADNPLSEIYKIYME